MTFAELLSGLPNGLRDAALRELRYDLTQERLILEVEVCVGDPQALTAQAREVSRPARLVFDRVSGLIIETPAARRSAERAGQPEWVSAESNSNQVPPAEDPGAPAREAVALFRHETNSFIRFVSASVDLEWLEDDRTYG